MPLSNAPNPLPENMVQLLKQFAVAWAKSPARPRISNDRQAKWGSFIEEWIEADDIPLFVRKGKDKGAVHVNAGRKFIVTDNSPAQWVYSEASEKDPPTLDAVRNSFLRTEDSSLKVQEIIPIALVLSTEHSRESERYKKALSRETDVNSKGWKLAHIDNVGLNKMGPISTIEINLLIENFRKLMLPSNMFVIPKCWAGIAETPELIAAMKAENTNSMGS
jgi:hypothetical protein